MIQYNVLRRIFEQLGEKYKVDMSPFIKKMNPRRLTHNLTDERLVEIEALKPGRVIYDGGVGKSRKRAILIFPKRKAQHTATNQAIELLETHLHEREILGLKRLADLAYELQNNDPSKIPSYEEVIVRLNSLFSSARKRLFSAMEGDDRLIIDEGEQKESTPRLNRSVTLTASVSIDEESISGPGRSATRIASSSTDVENSSGSIRGSQNSHSSKKRRTTTLVLEPEDN